MKVLLFTLEYPPFKGGVANVYQNIVKFWPEKEGVSVLNNNNNQLIKKFFPILKWLPGFLRLRKEFKNNSFNHLLVGHVLPLGTIAYFFFKIKKVNYSIILHGMDFAYTQKSIRKKWITKRILLNADNIFCMNSYVANLVIKKYGAIIKDKIVIVNPGINSSISVSNKQCKKLIQKYNLSGKKVIFSISRLVKRKGIDMTIRAMENVLQKIPNAIYFVAGTGPDEEYLKDIKNDLPNNIKNNIIFLGKISDEDKWAWLSVCDLFVMPSRQIEGDFEGFGIVYLEANLCGKPVIAGNSGGIGDAVINAHTGYRVNPDDTNDISHNIVKILVNPGLQKLLGNNGKERVLRDFQWSDKVGIIYKKIKQ